ncbi:MAG: ABC transporter permease subunit [Actinobacteria bacterium]|nr:ABC transporter permease subunit [Actinomycetota bacterium]
MKSTSIVQAIKRVFAAIFSIGVVLLLWYIITNGTKLGEIMPGPIVVIIKFFKALYTNIGNYTIIGHIMWSLSRVMVAYTAGAILGVALGLSMGRYKLFEAILRPFYEIIRPIPPIAWIPIAIIWFGLGEISKDFIIFISSFTIITLNAFAGARAVSPVLVGAAKMLGAKSHQIFFSIVLPSSIPFIFAGLQAALSASWGTVLAAEMVHASEGVGWIIFSGMENNMPTQIFVGMIAIGIVGFLLINIMRGVEAKLCEWSKSGT